MSPSEFREQQIARGIYPGGELGRAAGIGMNALDDPAMRLAYFIFAGPGIEYFTRLRHFSIGLEATGSYLVNTGTIGFSVSPNLRFAF